MFVLFVSLKTQFLVGRRKGGFFIFDSHSTSHKGLPHVDGRSVCMLFNDIDDVSTHIQELAKSMDIGETVECEVTGVIVLGSQQHKEGSDDVHFCINDFHAPSICTADRRYSKTLV